jgi:hypothetical protein
VVDNLLATDRLLLWFDRESALLAWHLSLALLAPISQVHDREQEYDDANDDVGFVEVGGDHRLASAHSRYSDITNASFNPSATPATAH